jgi:hypothetical protein
MRKLRDNKKKGKGDVSNQTTEWHHFTRHPGCRFRGGHHHWWNYWGKLRNARGRNQPYGERRSIRR